ncbi:MAG: GNAT family N-acetyltransferase [Actinomycetota bacterium]
MIVPALDTSVYLRSLRLSDASSVLDLRLRNRDFFRPFEPLQSERHFTLPGQREEIERCIEDADRDRRYAFGVFARDDNEIVGRIALSNVSRGAWQNATIGYYVDRWRSGRGYATDAVRLALRFAFEVARLHRVQGAALPDNIASIRVLEKAGFRREGVAKSYIEINGRWRDHEIFAITQEDWNGPYGA